MSIESVLFDRLRAAETALIDEAAALDEATRHALELSDECERLKALEEEQDDRVGVVKKALVTLAGLVTSGKSCEAYRFACSVQDDDEAGS